MTPRSRFSMPSTTASQPRKSKPDPSIPSFETPQTAAAESTTHTDSDADCENSKNHPRKSKPDKKKKRTTNLGPRVRVMNSTAITDEKEEVTEVKLECHLEVKTEDSCGKTLTFEFSYPDVDPVEISQEFVKISYIKEHHREIVLHQINDIVRQLNDNSRKTPIVTFPPDIHHPLDLQNSTPAKLNACQDNMDGTNKCVEDGSTELVKVALSQSARNETGRFSIS